MTETGELGWKMKEKPAHESEARAGGRGRLAMAGSPLLQSPCTA